MTTLDPLASTSATHVGRPIATPEGTPNLGIPDAERYVVQDWLGRGGFGEVYQVFDRERGESVAMKVLRRSAPRDLERFKREFRAIADLVHPNLVTLHELGARDGVWYFTMELIEGVDLRTWVRGSRGPSATGSFEATTGDVDLDELAAELEAERAWDADRFAQATRQLVDAVHALHRADRLHRDLKPSNVLVTDDDRLVLLDFGLVKRLDGDHTSTHRVMGTAAYMAPEQAEQGGVTEASDWYAVGVILFELLTGRTPFRGDFMSVLRRKATRNAPSVRRAAPSADPAVCAMIQRMLSRSPDRRPTGDEIAAWASAFGPSGAAAPSTPSGPRLPEVPIVGRDRELERLRDRFEAAWGGSPRLVCVHGEPGSGKSSLARRWLAEIRSRDDVLVLGSRCFERESVPYKAFEGLVRELLVSLRRDTRRLPQVVEAGAVLGEIFPALGHLAEASDVFQSLPPDPHERIELAREAMANLLHLAAGDRMLVLFVDDLQWGDIESAELLADLLDERWPRGLFVIGCYRTRERTQCVTTLLGSDALAAEVEMLPLSREDTEQLAFQLLNDPDAAIDVSRESHGDPLLLRELARYRLEHEDAAAGLSLDELFRARLATLPDIERAVVEAVCVAAQPTSEAVARQVVGGGLDAALALRHLLGERWLRRAGGAANRVVAWHDRMRTAVVDGLAPERLRELHLSIAEALRTDGGVQPQTLVAHYAAGGAPDLATTWALAAAERAERALAFDRAADLYRSALGLGCLDEDDEVVEVRRQLADALANAGRPAEAADAYLAVAADSGRSAALEARQRAAEQLIRGGHVDRGLDVARDVLDAVGVRVVRDPRAATVAMVARRAWLKMRGLSHTPATEARLSEEDRLRIDMGFAIGAGLALTDTIGGLDVHTRTLLDCLRVGEPYRLSRALALEAGYHAAFTGERGAEHSARLIDMSRALASSLDRPQAEALVDILAANVAWCEGRHPACRQLTERGIAVLRERCTGVDWELSFAQTHLFDTMAWMGDWHQLTEALPGAIERARERGDLYSEMMFTLRLVPLASHAADEPERGRAALGELRRWSTRVFDLEHLVALYQTVENALYRDDPATLDRTFGDLWPALERSGLLRMEKFYVELRELRARASLTRARHERGLRRRRLVADARRDASAIDRRGTTWSAGLRGAILAGAAALDGDAETAVGLLHHAERDLTQHAQHMYARVARWHRARLEGDADAQAQAAAEMRAHGVAAPEHVARMLMPGLAPV